MSGTTMTHAQWAALNPPNPGYRCTTDPKGNTYGGGCFNCGWKPAKPKRAPSEKVSRFRGALKFATLMREAS